MKDQAAGLRKTYDHIAPHFAQTRQEPWPETVSFLKDLADTGLGSAAGKVLDLGCGNGRNTLYALTLQLPVLALDFSSHLLRLLAAEAKKRELEDRLTMVQADIRSLPLRDNSVAALLGVAVIHHLGTREERLLALKEATRVLKPGAPVLLSAWAFDQPRFSAELEDHRERFGEEGEGFADVLVDWHFTPPGEKPGSCHSKVFKRFYHLFLPGELERLCEEAGFIVESGFCSGNNHYVTARSPGSK